MAGGFTIGGASSFLTISPIQIIQTVTNSVASTTSSSFTDTNCTGVITPTLSTSKILVIVNGAGYNTAQDGYATIARNGTNLLDASFGGVNFQDAYPCPVRWFFYDSPGTTSALTYKVRIRSSGGVSTTYFAYNCTALMILMEIPQ